MCIRDSILYGQNDNDTYEWNWGDGHDYISDGIVTTGGRDRLELAAGVLPEHLSFERDDVTSSTYLTGWEHSLAGDEIRVIITHPSDESLSGSVVIDRWDVYFGSWEIALVDGATLEGRFLGTDISDTLTGDDGDNLIYGGANSDLLIGNDGADVLIGGIGSDILSGGHGSDTFIIDVRLETDSIAYDVSEKLDGDLDRISLRSPDIHDALILVHDPETNELILLNTTTSTQIVVVEGWDMSLEDSLLPIQEITFSSGETWDIQEIQSRIIDGSQDFNNDGLSALNDIALGFDPFGTDSDEDGLSNLHERLLGTNIFRADSDGDGVVDSLDADPRNALITTINDFPSSSVLEITIDLPLNAVLTE